MLLLAKSSVLLVEELGGGSLGNRYLLALFSLIGDRDGEVGENENPAVNDKWRDALNQ